MIGSVVKKGDEDNVINSMNKGDIVDSMVLFLILLKLLNITEL